MIWAPSSPESSGSLVLSLEELVLVRRLLEGLLRELERLPPETFSRQSRLTSLGATRLRAHKLSAFLSMPSSTYTVTRSSAPSPPDTSTAFLPTHDEKVHVNDASKSLLRQQAVKW
jgi:hypothetical protein